MEVSIPYPGALATPDEIRSLADEYRRAALDLLSLDGRRQPLASAPCRLLALHAVELYLNAFLRDRGRPAPEVRGLHHDLAARTALAVAAGMVLRRRTIAHLHALSEAREYLTNRYAPDQAGRASHLNRVTATLNEVATKTQPACPPRSCRGLPTDVPAAGAQGRP